MKKWGDRWKKYKNLEKYILEILSEKQMPISKIQSELKIKVAWITIKNYLDSLYKSKKVIKTTLGRYNFWSK